MPFLPVCDPSLSGVSGSPSLELNLWHAAASFLPMQNCRVATEVQGCEDWFCLDLWSVCRFLPSSMGCNNTKRTVMGGWYRYRTDTIKLRRAQFIEVSRSSVFREKRAFLSRTPARQRLHPEYWTVQVLTGRVVINAMSPRRHCLKAQQKQNNTTSRRSVVVRTTRKEEKQNQQKQKSQAQHLRRRQPGRGPKHLTTLESR